MRWAAVVGLMCIPCLVPLLIAAGVGAGAFAAIGAWLSGNALVLAAAAVVGLGAGSFGWLLYTRRMKPTVSRDERQVR